MAALENWQATAFNQSEDSTNQIHSDEMAQTYGFKGALVPGVTVTSYLMHPAVKAWGVDWLSRGHCHSVVTKPLYDGFKFDVALNADTIANTNVAYHAMLTDQEGTQCAVASCKLNDAPETPNTMRGDALLSKDYALPNAERNNMERLRDKGMFALPEVWQASNRMHTYLADADTMPGIHRVNESGSPTSGYANGAYLLSLTNWVLAGNAYMNPWIHLQTTSQYYSPVALDTALIAECNIEDLFNRKGHEFVDLNVDVYERDTAKPVMKAMLRAIYKLKAP